MDYTRQQRSPFQISVRVDNNMPLPVSPAKKKASSTTVSNSAKNAGATDHLRHLYFRSLPSLALQLGLFTFFLTGYGSIYSVQQSIVFHEGVPMSGDVGALTCFQVAHLTQNERMWRQFTWAGIFAVIAAICVPLAAILKRSAPIVWAFSFFALSGLPVQIHEVIRVGGSNAKYSAIIVSLVFIPGILLGMFYAVKARNEESAFGNLALNGIAYPLVSSVLAVSGSTASGQGPSALASDHWTTIALGCITGILMLYFQWYFKAPSRALIIYAFGWFAFRVIYSNRDQFGDNSEMHNSEMSWGIWSALQLNAVCALLTLGALASVCKESISKEYASLFLCCAAVLGAVSETWAAYAVGSYSAIGAGLATCLLIVAAERRYRFGSPMCAPHHRQVTFYTSVWTLSWAAFYFVRAGNFLHEHKAVDYYSMIEGFGIAIAGSFIALAAALAMTVLACIALYKMK